MNKGPIRCDECGRFISHADLEQRKAVRFIHDLEAETLCIKHNLGYQAKLEDQILVTTD